LDNGTGDEDYLNRLREGVQYALDHADADIAFFLSGADAWEGDRLGKLSLTKAGLIERDRTVFDMCFERNIPVAVMMGGGYAPDVEDIADIHFNTARTVAQMAQVWAQKSTV
ncbi:MAG: histone deacetylase, partial [Chloroflexota bacterium]